MLAQPGQEFGALIEKAARRQADERLIALDQGVLVLGLLVVGGALQRLPVLAIAAETEVEEEEDGPAEDPEIDPETLSFPATLTDTRPEVAVAVAAATAELAHLDPVTSKPPRSEDIAAGLPAAVTAGPDGEVVELAAKHDPLVAATVPQNTKSAPAGYEGRYTLQVISYRSAEEARIFASALRKRGHAAYVTTGNVEDRGMHWRVRIGPFETRQEAQSYRTTFEREEGMNTFVVRNKD